MLDSYRWVDLWGATSGGRPLAYHNAASPSCHSGPAPAVNNRRMPTRYISGGDGTRIAVYDEGNPDGPTVVLVHGWPDSHVLWDGVVPLLAHNYRIIRYDSRGAGASDVPRPVDAYRVDRLADDFAAVVDQLCPGTRVHVVGHDWGAATMWEYVSRPDAADRVASYTSISGPHPGHLSRYVRDGLAHPIGRGGSVGRCVRPSTSATCFPSPFRYSPRWPCDPFSPSGVTGI